MKDDNLNDIDFNDRMDVVEEKFMTRKLIII